MSYVNTESELEARRLTDEFYYLQKQLWKILNECIRLADERDDVKDLRAKIILVEEQLRENR